MTPPDPEPFTASPTAQRALCELARVPLCGAPTPVEELPRLSHVLGGGPRLFVKRDDAIAFGGGGNKVRKLEAVLAEARAQGAETLVTCGGLQSNHARATAAAAARLGLGCVLVLNGPRDTPPAGNHLLMRLFGAEIVHVDSRASRASMMDVTVERLRREGRRPYAIPLGASTALGAAGFASGVAELAALPFVPDVIVHATSSGGTQAGVLAGCVAHGIDVQVVGISADDPSHAIAETVRGILMEMRPILGDEAVSRAAVDRIQVDDRFVGAGYAIPTAASTEAAQLSARTEGLILDPVYTAKAMAALIAYVREGRFAAGQRVLFWHTGGVPGVFA